MQPTPRFAPWLMLFARPVLFLAVQTAFAAAFWVAGAAMPWEQAANWWLITVSIADLICLALLSRLFAAEGRRLRDLFRIQRSRIRGDLLALLGLTLVTAPVALLPNLMLGQVLFDNPDDLMALFVRPIPMWAALVAVFLFPVAQGLSETPTYFGYVMPRLAAQGVNKWLAIALPALMLGLQHVAAPLLFNVPFMLWRGLMYIPFAFVVGFAFHWRPSLLPYFVVVHIMMNVSLAVMFLQVAP